jgi:hypothetical protein
MTKCNENGCKKSASFGIIYKVPIHCNDHKEDDEENVKHKRCEYENCKKTSSYGLIGKTAIHCKLHADEDEIDVRHSRCKERGCNSRPTFGLIDGKVNHCNIHAKENEIDLNNKKVCQENGCSKRPSYGPEAGVLLHCFEHYKDDEENQKHKKCEYKNCKTIAGFGIKKAIHCYEHKKDNEKCITRSKCEYHKCDKRPIYGVKGQPPKHCSAHKNENEIDLNSIRCKDCGLFTVGKKPYKCSYCKDDSDKRKKTKEMKVVDYFKEQKMDFIHNKSVGAECGSYRPDLLFDTGTHFVVVEIDEEQHKSVTDNSRYGNICERVRENNIFIALGLPTVFIRYNPDSYKIDGKTIKMYSKQRLSILQNKVNYHLKNIPEKHISAEFLFYDDYDKKTEEYQSINVKQLIEFQRELGV